MRWKARMKIKELLPLKVYPMLLKMYCYKSLACVYFSSLGVFGVLWLWRRALLPIRKYANA